jgi:hypothetical protein
VDLIPKVLIAGVFTPPPQVPGGPELTIERLNRTWAEVAPMYGYRQLHVEPDSSAAQFLGSSSDDAVVIQPPLIQVRDPISIGGPGQSAEKAQEILKVIARHLGVDQFFNFAVRHVFWAPAPGSDARAFVLHQLLGKTEEDLGELEAGGGIWAGLKFVVSQNGNQYTLTIEPLQRDETMLYIDLNAEFPGPASLDNIVDRASDAHQYVRGAVSTYLDKH